MIDLWKGKDHCCSCGGCAYVCPHSAIHMETGGEGLPYPVIDEEACTECGLCIKNCVFQRRQGEAPRESAEMPKKGVAFAAKASDEVREKSQSGGAFKLLSDQVLAEDGVVYGAAVCEDFTVRHIRAQTVKERDRLRGSKYVQSDATAVYPLIRRDLETGRIVLFSGCSCQVAQVGSLFSGHPSLYLVDILCHGTASPRLFEEYLDFQKKRYQRPLTAVDFRNKGRYGWNSHIETLMFYGKRYDGDLWTRLFYSHLAMPCACYSCPYKSISRQSDITVADCWGIERVNPGFADNRGVSLVMVSTPRGEELFSRVPDWKYVPVRLDDIMQTPLIEPYSQPKNRDVFWQEYENRGFAHVLKRYMGYTLKGRVRSRLRSLMYAVKKRVK